MSKNDHYILAHGLNVQPSVMQSLAEELGCAEDQSTIISLPGHAADETLHPDAAYRWLDSFRDQYQAAYERNQNIVFLGYSLGGLLMTYLLGDKQINQPRKQVLFAPALAFQQWTKIPTLITTSTLDQIVIPSFTPKRFKANSGVSLGAYKVLFQISRELNAMDPAHYNIPTLVLCDQRDELVQPAGLRKFIVEKQLIEWKLYIVPSSPWERLGKKHLLVAREYQSKAYWDEIRQQIDAFIHG
ncbi:MAG: alpha/beta hydrolase [Bacteroidota bacterium]